jgi:hypothetical protein
VVIDLNGYSGIVDGPGGGIINDPVVPIIYYSGPSYGIPGFSLTTGYGNPSQAIVSLQFIFCGITLQFGFGSSSMLTNGGFGFGLPNGGTVQFNNQTNFTLTWSAIGRSPIVQYYFLQPAQDFLSM